jgi:hypothetical protein
MIHKEGPSNFSERNVPLNVQSFVPIPINQHQQLYLHQKQQNDQIGQSKTRSSHLKLGQGMAVNMPNEYSNGNFEEDVLNSILLDILLF